MEPTTKKWKTEKLKGKNGYAHGKQSEESAETVLKTTIFKPHASYAMLFLLNFWISHSRC